MIAEFFQFVKVDLKNKGFYALLLLLAILIYFNYKLNFEDSVLDRYNNTFPGLVYYFLMYIGVYLLSVAFIQPKNIGELLRNRTFMLWVICAFVALACYQSFHLIYLWKENASVSYFQKKIDYRLNSLLIFFLMMVFLGGILGKGKEYFYGLFQYKFQKKYYFYFLGAMMPLLLWAAHQPDFLHSYPRLKSEYFSKEEYPRALLRFEPLYLLDFIGVEWYFRGFLILAFYPFLNRNTLLPAAAVYATFHFGKPMAECISSFFGGYLLGYMVLKNNSIWGGVFLHMGIAFLMDAFSFFVKFGI